MNLPSERDASPVIKNCAKGTPNLAEVKVTTLLGGGAESESIEVGGGRPRLT